MPTRRRHFHLQHRANHYRGLPRAGAMAPADDERDVEDEVAGDCPLGLIREELKSLFS